MYSKSMLVVTMAATLSSACTDRPDEPEPMLGAQRGAAVHGDGLVSDLEPFAHEAAVATLAELQLARLAADRARSADVQEFAQMMIRDHGEALTRLREAARAQGADLPTAPDAEHLRVEDRLAALSGRAFDEEYMRVMVDSHERTLQLLEDGASLPGDREAALATWASDSLSMVRRHLEHAESIRRQVGESS